jgi:hypothetical protein
MDFCGQCQRRVHNLDLMSDPEREAFLTGCSGDVCVSYTVKRTVLTGCSGDVCVSYTVKRTAVALSLGLAAVVGVPTNAADVAAPNVVVMQDSQYCSTEEILLGGTRAGAKLQWVDESEAARPDKQELPDIEASTWLPTPKP